MDKNHDVIIFISKYVYVNKEAGLANSANIKEIAMILIINLRRFSKSQEN